jgi:alpha-methylacyl-CoA racemase
VFEGSDACVAPVLSMTEAPSYPHLAARGTYASVDGVLQPTPAPRFCDGAAPAAAFVPGPIARAGAHTRKVLTGLGLDDVDELLADGAVWQALAGGLA